MAELDDDDFDDDDFDDDDFNVDDEEPEETPLSRERRATLEKYGPIDENVLGRLRPSLMPVDGVEDEVEPIVWPAQALGRLLIVHRPHSTLFVTDGLSEPWIWKEPPGKEEPWAFELAIETRKRDGEPFPPWVPDVMWSMTDWILGERYDVSSVLAKFRLATLAAFPDHPDLAHLVVNDRGVGFLAGLALTHNGVVQGGIRLAVREPQDVLLIHLVLLTKDEYEFALETPDATNTQKIAEHIKASGTLVSDPTRPSFLKARDP